MAKVFWIKKLEKQSPEKQKIIYAGGVVLVAGVVGVLIYFFYPTKPSPALSPPLPGFQRTTLTAEETEELVKAMTPSTTKSTLTPQETRNLRKAMTPKSNATTTLTAEQTKQLLDAMTPKQ